MDPHTVYEGLSKWLDTFNLSRPHMTPDDLSDGTAVAEFLHQLDPSFFSQEWLSRLIEDCGGNMIVKTNNLKKIVKRILQYFDEVHNIQLAGFPQPDVSKIAQTSDEGEVAKLLQLALGIAIHCEQKQAHVQAIRNMDESLQLVVMSAIQELLNGCQQKPKSISGEEFYEIEERLKEALSNVSVLEAERDDLAQSKFDLESRLKMKEEEIEELRQEMRDKALAFEPGTPREVKNELHFREVDQMRQEMMKEQAIKEEYRMRTEEAEQHIEELVQKNRELSSQLDNLSMLQDQLEEMRHLEDKVNRYEQMIATYKIKLEDATDMKKNMKGLEEKTSMYMQQILDLEEELRKMSSVKVQLKTYKQRIQELERNLLEERTGRKAVSHDLEIKSQELSSLQMEVKHLQELSKTNKTTPSSSELPVKEEIDFSGLSGLSPLVEAYTPELKERMVRLEKENQILKSRLSGPSDQNIEEVATLQAELEMANDRLKEYESHVGMSGGVVLAGDQTQAKRIKLLEEDVESKTAEIEKLKKYLNKAKKIIEGFGNKPNVTEESGEIHVLKQQLVDRESYIQRLEEKVEQNRELKEREERLIVTAWYDLGMQMFQQRSEQRLVSNMPFLAQQRQALFSRRSAMNQTPNSVSASPSLRTAS